MKKAIKFSFATAAVVATLGAAVAPTLVSAWGDNSGLPNMRPSYTLEQIDKGVLGDKITFNSISNDPTIGDEKNFVSARKYNDTDLSHPWRDNDITVEDGGEYVIRMYVHNNSPKGYNAIAKDVRSFFKVPGTSAKSVRVVGYLDSSNATPTEYWDQVNFNSDTAFHLEYVSGSAKITNNILKDGKATGQTRDTALSDEIVTNSKGVLIGSESLNGEIPGCYDFSAMVTIRVKAYFDRDYTVATKVRLVGDADKTWKKEVDAKEGDKVEFQINYTNTGKTTQRNVIIDDDLPTNLKYVEGTTKLYDGLYPTGTILTNNSITGDGIIIGDYTAGSNALIRFQAEVVDEDFTCGKFILHNWGRATVGQTVIQDSAAVNVQLAYCPDPEEPATPVDPEKPTEPTTPTNPTTPGTPSELPSTGPVAVAGSVIGIGSIVTAAGYYIASRRALR